MGICGLASGCPIFTSSPPAGGGDRRMTARTGLLAVLAVGALALAGCTSGGETGTAARVASAPGSLRVEVVGGGLTHPWDLAFLPDGRVLLTQRPGRLTLLSSAAAGATATDVAADLSDVYVRGEGGLMGLALHPDFASSRLFTTCQTHAEAGRPVDVRLVTWRLADDDRSAQRVRELVNDVRASPSLGPVPLDAPDRLIPGHRGHLRLGQTDLGDQ